MLEINLEVVNVLDIELALNDMFGQGRHGTTCTLSAWMTGAKIFGRA
jgi:hypothetical protein